MQRSNRKSPDQNSQHSATRLALPSSAKGLGWSTCQSCQITLWRCPSVANVRSARHESCLREGSESLQDRTIKKVRPWASDSNLPKSQVCISMRYRNIRRLFLQTLWKETGPLFPKHDQWLLTLKSGRKKYQMNLNHISYRFSENWKASCQDFLFWRLCLRWKLKGFLFVDSSV